MGTYVRARWPFARSASMDRSIDLLCTYIIDQWRICTWSNPCEASQHVRQSSTAAMVHVRTRRSIHACQLGLTTYVYTAWRIGTWLTLLAGTLTSHSIEWSWRCRGSIRRRPCRHHRCMLLQSVTHDTRKLIMHARTAAYAACMHGARWHAWGALGCRASTPCRIHCPPLQGL
jgi:hypothetical protein